MTRITALLIVLTLTAAPTAIASCCHEGVTAVPELMIEAGHHGCGAVLERTTASLMDTRAAAGAAVVLQVQARPAPATEATAAPVRLLTPTGPWLRPAGVLRL